MTALAVGLAIVNIGMAAVNPLLPLIRAEFQLGGMATGLLAASMTFPYMATQLPAGLIADRIGAKRVLTVLTLVSALGLTAVGLWSYSLFALIGLKFFHRVGAGAFYPVAFGVTGRAVAPEARGKASGLLVAGMALGTPLGLSLAVPVASLAGDDWRFPLLSAGLLLLPLPLVYGLLRWPAQPPRSAVPSRLGPVLRDRSLLGLFAISFWSNFAFQPSPFGSTDQS